MTVKLEVTEEAKRRVQELLRSQKPGTAVRIYLQAGGGGGCGCGDGGCGSSAGPQLGMSLDSARNGDEVVPVDGFSFLVDPSSAELVNGLRIDFVNELDMSGFKLSSPLDPPAPSTEGGCGCGSGGCC
ncbi:MAG: iron-sulfur cluster biosynthesis family protein [Thermoplasmata archaeon]